MNLRPPGYEPGELPGCSTPRRGVHCSRRRRVTRAPFPQAGHAPPLVPPRRRCTSMPMHAGRGVHWHGSTAPCARPPATRTAKVGANSAPDLRVTTSESPSPELFGELLDAPLDQGAKAVVNAHRQDTLEIDWQDEGIILDIDTPELYRQHVKENKCPD